MVFIFPYEWNNGHCQRTSKSVCVCNVHHVYVMALCVWIMDTNVSDNKGNLCTDMSPNERRKIIKLKMINELFIRSVCVYTAHTCVYCQNNKKKNIQYEAVSISVVSIDIIQQPVTLIVTRKQRC